jgi:Fe2+ transport system protein FeoA
MVLSELKNGDAFKVNRVTLTKEVGKKLADMGFTAGAMGSIVRSALLGDPIQVRILGYHVSIRKMEAAGIEAEMVNTPRLATSGVGA